MAFQFIFHQKKNNKKIIDQRKKLSMSDLLTLLKGQFLSKPYQAQTAFWQFQFSYEQPRSCEMIQKIPKILDMPVYIFQTKYFHECNHMKEKKSPTYENLALHTLDSTYEPISYINWVVSFLVAYMGFLHKSKFQLHWSYIPHCISNVSPLWKDHTVCYNENPSSLVTPPVP